MILFRNLKIIWFLHLFALYFLGEDLATEQLAVAETPMSELLESEVLITKCNTRISSAEDARPLITDLTSAGEFKLLLFAILQVNSRYNHIIYYIISFIIMLVSLSNYVLNENFVFHVLSTRGSEHNFSRFSI